MSEQPMLASEATRDGWRLNAAASRTEMIERLKFQVAFADGALKSLMLANGGALIALFTFIGNLAGKTSAPITFNMGLLWLSFTAFALGLAGTLVASLCAFMSQGHYYEVAMREASFFQTRSETGTTPDLDPRLAPLARGRWWEIGGILSAVLTMTLFVIGAGLALGAVIPR